MSTGLIEVKLKIMPQKSNKKISGNQNLRYENVMRIRVIRIFKQEIKEGLRFVLKKNRKKIKRKFIGIE